MRTRDMISRRGVIAGAGAALAAGSAAGQSLISPMSVPNARKKGGGWTPANDLTSWAFFDAAGKAGGLAAWDSANVPALQTVQATAANQPAASSGVVTFDGVNDRLVGTYAPCRYLGPQTMPYMAGVVGPTFGAPTGLTRTPDGFWWLSTDGRDYGVGTYNPFLIKLSSDKTTILDTIDLAPIYPGIVSVQGIVWDESDSTIWLTDQGANKVRHINPVTKAAITADEITLSTIVPNGLGRNATTDTLYVGDNSSGVIQEWSCATSTQVSTKTITIASRDHFWADGTVLMITAGANDGPGTVSVYDYATNIRLAIYSLPENLAIEAVVPVATGLGTYQLHTVNDSWFHQAGDKVNKFNIYEVKPWTASVLDFWYVGKMTWSANNFLITSGADPTSNPGWCLAFPSANVFQFVVNTTASGTAQRLVFTGNISSLAGLSFGVDHLVYFRVDTDNNLATLWIDGVQIATASAAAPNGILPMHAATLTLGAFTGGANPSNSAIKALGIHAGAGDRAKIQAWAAANKGVVLAA